MHEEENLASEILSEEERAATIVAMFKAGGYTFAIITNPGDRITFHKGTNTRTGDHSYPKYLSINDQALIPELMDSMAKGNDYSRIIPAINADPTPYS